MKWSKAAGLSAVNTQDGLAPYSCAGTAWRYEKPNQQEGFLQ